MTYCGDNESDVCLIPLLIDQLLFCFLWHPERNAYETSIAKEKMSAL